jgi:hypothetical protein
MEQAWYEKYLPSILLSYNNSHENVRVFCFEYSHYILQRYLNICDHMYRSAIINKRFVIYTSMNKEEEKTGMASHG